MTALDSYVEEPTRAEAIAEISALINRIGIQYLYLQFVSTTGRLVGKGIPAEHWESVARHGIQLVYGSTANVATDRHGRYLGYGPEAAELVAIPEPETFAQLPWDHRVARVFTRLFRNREDNERAGEVLTSDCRGNLARQSEEFARQHDGLHLRVGTEPEMMWLRRSDDGCGLRGATKPYCYHIDQFEELREPMLRTIDYAGKMGLNMIQGDHEDAPGQLELNFHHDDALRNADRLITYRQICRQVAREFGLDACFMAKPFLGVSGSGCHHNLSLWLGGEERNVLPRRGMDGGAAAVFMHHIGGRNMLLNEDGTREPSKLGLHAIGGIMHHLDALTAIGASTVNSYRRILDSGFWAPMSAAWGYQNRTCALRVSAPGRLEYRSVDSMVNPYLMASGLLAAIDDGIHNSLEPGPPEQGNAYHSAADSSSVAQLPKNLGDALAALDRDETVRRSLPGEMYTVYRECKQAEWDAFLATVTEWDLKTYEDYVS